MEKEKKNNILTKYLVKLGILPILLLVFLIFTILAPNKFLSADNIVNIFRAGAINMVVAIGMTLVIITGGIDLSIGSVVAVSGVTALSLSFVAPWLTIPAAIMVGATAGFINGVLVAYVKLPPFIVTLGAMTYLRGFAYIICDGNSIINNDLPYRWIGSAYLGPIPWLVIIAVAMILIVNYLMKHTIYGKKVYAVGANSKAANYTGIRVKRMLISVYVLSGVMAGIGGIMVTSRLHMANGQIGTLYELDAIASTIIGGTSFTGGKGTVIGTMLGALVIAMLNNGLTVMGVSYYWQQVARGLVIVLAVMIDIFRNKLILKMQY